MAVTHPTAVRNALADLVVDRLDAGATAGYMEFQTAGGAEVATCPFSDPAFGAAAGGVATANAIAADTNATGGIIAKAQCKDSDGNVAYEFSVTAEGGGGDVEMNSVEISAGQKVEVESHSYTAAA